MDTKFDRRLEVLTATMAEGFKAMDARFERMEVRFDGKLDKMGDKLSELDAKFEGKLDTLGKRRFTLLIALLSATVTLVAAVLGVLLHGPHAH